MKALTLIVIVSKTVVGTTLARTKNLKESTMFLNISNSVFVRKVQLKISEKQVVIVFAT